MSEFVSPEIHQIAMWAQRDNDSYVSWEGDGIAQCVLLYAAKKLKDFAVERFDAHGPHDARGAAFWDAAAYLDETLVGDPLTRGTVNFHEGNYES